MDKSAIVEKNLKNSIKLKNMILSNMEMINSLVHLTDLIVDRYQKGGKVLFCGNGGSAADAQHLAAEFSGRYYLDRSPLFAEALHVNTSYLTAVANDYSYDEVYSRLIRAIGSKGDILIGLSTSGNSKNIVNALKQASELDMTTVGFTGQNGGEMKNFCNYLLSRRQS